MSAQIARERDGHPVVARQMVPHNPDESYHAWVFLPGFRGEPITVKRSALGRRHPRAWRDWIVLICNNGDCPGRAIVSAEVVCDLATDAIRDEG